MEQASVAKTLSALLEQKKLSVAELSERTGIPRTTLYSMSKKSTNQVDLGHLKRLADFFGENISIFCGLEDYEPPLRLSDEERLVLTIYRSLNAAGKKKAKVGSLFRTGKGGAHGFGLHRAETILKQHGGWVKYNSEDGAFTSEFLVPAVE